MTTAFANPAAKVELHRVFDAPARLVYEAWSRPELWSRWFPPRGFTMTVSHMDFREGGTFDATFHGPESWGDHTFSGTYVELVPNERVVWAGRFPDGPEDQMLTTMSMKEVGGKTEVTVVQAFRVMTPIAEQAIQGAQEGWTQTLDKLGEYLAEIV